MNHSEEDRLGQVDPADLDQWTMTLSSALASIKELLETAKGPADELEMANLVHVMDELEMAEEHVDTALRKLRAFQDA